MFAIAGSNNYNYCYAYSQFTGNKSRGNESGEFVESGIVVAGCKLLVNMENRKFTQTSINCPYANTSELTTNN